MVEKKNSGVIAAGLALFSMFFGAGDLIWPLILGGVSHSQNFYALLGLLITGVSLPLLGLISMMLFHGDYYAFFGGLGKWASIVLIFIIQLILGPLGTIPRLFTLAHATLKPYMFSDITLPVFSVICCVIVFAFTIRPQRLIDILGLILTPVLLLSLGGILVLGLWNHPEPAVSDLTSFAAFKEGLGVGYNTLDLIASFIFAPFVLTYFTSDKHYDSTPEAKKLIFKKMLKASLLAAFLLSVMYIGLTYVASYYTLHLGEHMPEERLAAVSRHLLGPYGALISCIAVSMTCLTTAIPVTTIFAKYISYQFFNDQIKFIYPLILGLTVTYLMATMGFKGIADLLSPILQIICPGLIVLSLLNIFKVLFEKPIYKLPIFATFALSTVSYVV